MLCHQRAQLHSAYTVLDGGCCLFFPFSWMKSVRFFWALRVIWWWIVGAPGVRDWMSERAERERTWTQVCDAEKRHADCEKNLCERVWTKAASVFFCRTIRRTFIYILPSLLFCLPSSLSYIAIIYKELHLKKKNNQKNIYTCSGMFKWSTKYLCSCLIIWRECCVWCVFYLAVTELVWTWCDAVCGRGSGSGRWMRASVSSEWLNWGDVLMMKAKNASRRGCFCYVFWMLFICFVNLRELK